MVTSSNGNMFCEMGPLWGESIGLRWIPLTKTSDGKLWYDLSAPEQAVEWTIETPVIWDAMALIMTSLHGMLGGKQLGVVPWGALGLRLEP